MTYIEIHITVISDNIEKFKMDCEKIGVKPILIDTYTGNQWMTSSKHEINNTDDYMNYLLDIEQKLINHGYQIIRSKVEQFPNDNNEHLYLESHLRIKIPRKNFNLNLIHNILKKHNAHLSRNVLKYVDDYKYIMATLRSKNDEIKSFKEKVENLKKNINDELQKENIEIDKIEIEQCIYDSNENVDTQWFNLIR